MHKVKEKLKNLLTNQKECAIIYELSTRELLESKRAARPAKNFRKTFAKPLDKRDEV